MSAMCSFVMVYKRRCLKDEILNNKTRPNEIMIVMLLWINGPLPCHCPDYKRENNTWIIYLDIYWIIVHLCGLSTCLAQRFVYVFVRGTRVCLASVKINSNGVQYKGSRSIAKCDQ